MKTILFIGHLSRFGLGFLDAMLAQPAFNVKEIVVADAWLWSEFRCRLARKEVVPPNRKQKQEHRKVLYQIEKQISNLDIVISIVRDSNQQFLINRLANYDIMLTAAFPQIFSDGLSMAPRLGSVNFHPSFLPRCRGAHPVYWAIASQEPYSGISSHIITSKIDAGPLLARIRIEYDQETIVYQKLYDLSIKRLPELIQQTYAVLINEVNKPIPLEFPSYFRNDQPGHHEIHWRKDDKKKISAKIRAGNAFAINTSGRTVLLIPPVKVFNKKGNEELYTLGAISITSPGRCIIKCIDGYISTHFKIGFQSYLLRKIMGLFRRLKIRALCEYIMIKTNLIRLRQFKTVG